MAPALPVSTGATGGVREGAASVGTGGRWPPHMVGGAGASSAVHLDSHVLQGQHPDLLCQNQTIRGWSLLSGVSPHPWIPCRTPPRTSDGPPLSLREHVSETGCRAHWARCLLQRRDNADADDDKTVMTISE